MKTINTHLAGNKWCRTKPKFLEFAQLRAEPENKFDPNAIIVRQDAKIGYVPASVAAEIKDQLAFTFAVIAGGDEGSLWLYICQDQAEFLAQQQEMKQHLREEFEERMR